MRTPIEYTKNLNDGIITTEMMKDALFSVNKRAKNYRDTERECRKHYRGKYADSNRIKKEQLYSKKESLLGHISPTCIHREFVGFQRIRIYDYECNYLERYCYHLLTNSIVWMNSFYDYENDIYVRFFDYQDVEPSYRYYLYYICGNKTFHSPIEEKDVEKYNLDIVTIDYLDTAGEEPNSLMSLQFVDKMIKSLEEGTATYQKTLPDNPPVFQEFVQPEPRTEICREGVRLVLTELNEKLTEQVKNMDVPFTEEEVQEAIEYVYINHQKMKNKKKQMCYKTPKVKFDGSKFKVRFTSEEMVDYVFKKLKAYKGKNGYNGLIDYIQESCLSEESPIYEEMLEKTKNFKVSRKAVELVKEAAMELYEMDNTREITVRNGVAIYAD